MLHFEKLKTIKEDSEMEFDDWLCVCIENNNINQFVQKTRVLFPGFMNFVKQVKRVGEKYYVLVCKCNDYKIVTGESDSIYDLDTIKANLQDFLRLEMNELLIVKVPKWKPITKEQHEKAIEKWPCYNYVIKWQYPKIIEENYKKVLNGYKDDVCSSYCVFYDSENKCVAFEAEDDKSLFGHGIFKGVEEISQNTQDYLCTDLTLYILNEPCIACTMALVHGRIGDVFFINEKAPFSFSRLKINSRDNINHRYSVYQMFEDLDFID